MKMLSFLPMCQLCLSNLGISMFIIHFDGTNNFISNSANGTTGIGGTIL